MMGETRFLIWVLVTVVGSGCENGLVHVILEFHPSNITGNITIRCHFSLINLHSLIIQISKKVPEMDQEAPESRFSLIVRSAMSRQAEN